MFQVGERYTGSRGFMRKGQECKVSLSVYREMLQEVADQVTLYTGASQLSVVLADGKHRIESLAFATAGRGTTTLSASVFIDASYEGDLMRLAGVSYALGREANTTYNELHAGVQGWPFPGADAGQIFPPAINYTVDPWKAGGAGHREEDLLPLVNAVGLAPAGSADNKIMSYNFRVCLTNNKSNMVPLPKPSTYSPQQFELLARYLAVDPGLHALYIQKCPGGTCGLACPVL